MRSRAYLRPLVIGLLFASGLLANRADPIASAKSPTSVEVYPGPGDNTYRSRLYSVDVLNGSTWFSSYVYGYGRVSSSLWHWGSTPTVNFTTFGTSGSTSVRVSLLGNVITTADISPKSRSIPVQLTAGQALLTLKQGDKAWITLNGDDANPLFIFADALKPPVPSGATYFGIGVRDIAPGTGNHYIASNYETIYLDGGAWVRGNIDIRGKAQVRIMGPGVLSGELWTSESVQSLPTFDQMMDYTMIHGDWGGTNAIVQDITVVASPIYNLFGGTHQAYNVKLLSPWYYSTDGFQGVNSVDQSFAFVGDNVFFPIWSGIANGDVSVTNSFAGTAGNAVFCGGYWGNPGTQFKTSVQNIDIKTYNSDAWVQFGAPLTPAVFQIWMDSTNSAYGYSNQTYQDIRVEGDLSVPLLILKNMVYPWGGPNAVSPPLGNSYNLLFRNVTVAGRQNILSEIKGLDSANGFHNVRFENLSFNGTAVTQTNFANYISVNNYVSNLSFATCTAKQIAQGQCRP